MLKCFALVSHYFDNTHVKTYAILSFYTERVLMLFFCFCFVFLSVNLDKQTLDIGVLRKKNYSLFLECTFDMNNCYMYLFLLRKQIK